MTDFRLVRTLNFEMGSEQKTGDLVVGGIEEVRPGTWACHVALPYILVIPSKIYGIDPLRALQNCLEFIEQLIIGSEQDGYAIVWWLEKGDHGGFTEKKA